jgi:hypothetical protein
MPKVHLRRFVPCIAILLIFPKRRCRFVRCANRQRGDDAIEFGASVESRCVSLRDERRTAQIALRVAAAARARTRTLELVVVVDDDVQFDQRIVIIVDINDVVRQQSDVDFSGNAAFAFESVVVVAVAVGRWHEF